MVGLKHLPEPVWLKVKGFGEGRIGHTVGQSPVELGQTGAARRSPPFRRNGKGTTGGIKSLGLLKQTSGQGFRPADAHFVGRLARCPASRCAALRVDRLAGPETEWIQSSHERL